MTHSYSRDDLSNAIVETIRESGLEECYIRPVIFRGLDEAKPAFGVNPLPNPVDCYVAVWEWGKYLGDAALDSGIDVCVSSWTRITSNSLPAMAKAGELYEFATHKNGRDPWLFSEGIALDDRGDVSAARGKSFLVSDGKLLTPPLGASILPGITRDSVVQIARPGIEVIETTVQRAALYLADELFFTGTAAEITPIRSVDRIEIGWKGRADYQTSSG